MRFLAKDSHYSPSCGTKILIRIEVSWSNSLRILLFCKWRLKLIVQGLRRPQKLLFWAKDSHPPTYPSCMHVCIHWFGVHSVFFWQWLLPVTYRTKHGVYDVYKLRFPEVIVNTTGRVFRFHRVHTSVLFLVLPFLLTYRTKHGVDISIEWATSHQPLKHPSIICIPYVAGGGWELYIQGLTSKRIRCDRHRGEQLMTLP